MFVEFTQATDKLIIAGRRYGDSAATPVYLMHGFPYDVGCYDEVAPILAAHGCYVTVPYLRGYGATRFTDCATLRSGQQAALAKDLLSLMDADKTDRAIVAGFDWGGRAACIVSALWPERIIGLVTGGGYNIQNIATANEPADPGQELQYWYQFYFHSERGRRGLTANRREFCKLLWRLWSPRWNFSDEAFNRSAAAFDNSDFVDVVVHSYRHRYGLVAGDPDLIPIESELAAQPAINVPSIAIFGQDNGVLPAQSDTQVVQHFGGHCALKKLTGIGHNIPQEAPTVFAEAVLSLQSIA